MLAIIYNSSFEAGKKKMKKIKATKPNSTSGRPPNEHKARTTMISTGLAGD